MVLLALFAVVSLALLTAGCSSPAPRTSSDVSSTPVELDVSAASSLKRVLTDTAPAFEKEHNVKLVFNLGASGQLVKQIEGGAPADVFLSASPAAVTTLAAESLVTTSSGAMFAGNTLVILVPKGNPAGIHGPSDLAGATKLTTGDPAVAPHGQKAVEWLTNLGLWTGLSPNFVFAANATQTDDYIARGEVDAGIGFASDAAGRSDIEIAYTVPDGQIKPIRYEAAVVSATTHSDLAQAYIDYLNSSAAQNAFVSFGFTMAPGQ